VRVEGNVALHDPRVDPVLDEFRLAPHAGEEAAFIGKPFQFQKIHAGDSCILEDHGRVRSVIAVPFQSSSIFWE
jgi:hypothetical protein